MPTEVKTTIFNSEFDILTGVWYNVVSICS